MSSLARLKERLAKTLEAGRLDAALSAVAAISEIEPKDPIWPKRAARLFRANHDVAGQLAALRRALELQIGHGLVLDAIATCRSILELVPDDDETLDCLDLLYLNGSPQLSASSLEDSASSASSRGGITSESSAVRHDAPLDSILLSEAVPGARAVSLGDAEPGRVNEIPVDENSSGGNSGVIDLRLENWPGDETSTGLRAGQSPVAAQPLRSSKDSGSSPPLASSSAPTDRGHTLRAQLAQIPLFGELDPESLHLLIRKVRVVQLEAGQVLFRQGDAANSLYVVVDGAVVPIAEGERRRKLAVLERGDFFGEIGLITKQPRNATIEALVDTRLLAIDRRVLWQLIEQESKVLQILIRFLRARLIDRQIRTNLFFAAFAHAEREAVARQFRILEVKDGTRIVAAGKPPEGLFVVLSGRLELWTRGHGKCVRELGSGDVLGARALLEGSMTTLDAVACGKCWIVVLGEGRFRRILEANPRLDRVLRQLSRKSEGMPAVSAS